MTGRLVIGFSGDVMIGRLVNRCLSKVPPSELWGDMLSEIRSTDINIFNLEAALTRSNQKVDKVFNFKSDPANVQTLLEANVHAVNLANNHVLDYSESGLLETLQTLDDAGILHAGAGKNILEARRPVIVTKNGITIGLLGITDNEPGWEASEQAPGIRYVAVGDIDKIRPDIESLKRQVDIVILSAHLGPNMQQRPPGPMVDFIHSLMDAGVDIFHGHSAHIFQGIEYYGSKVIIYDAGDFVDDYYVDPRLRNDLSFFFKVIVDSEGVRDVRLVPTLISNFQVNHAKGGDFTEAVEKMKVLSQEFGTSLELKDNALKLMFDTTA